jgi:ribosomal protein S6--L-glutamate ligase
MKLAIISFKPLATQSAPEDRRLLQEAKKRGHKARIYRSGRFALYFDHCLGIKYAGKTFSGVDMVIPRVTALSNVALKAAILEHMQLMGVPTLTDYYAVVKAKNKLHTLQILTHYKIPCVKTVVIRDDDYIDEGLKFLGKTPVIMKNTHGSYGNGVVIVETKRAAKSAYGVLKQGTFGGQILIQEYIGESKGSDLRLFVLGGEVVGAMERKAKRGEFRSNLELGGDSSAFEPTTEMKNIAIRATKALNLELAGVDIIVTKNGPAVIEVNANPGFKGLEEATGLNIAEMVILHAEKFASQYVPHEMI